MEWRFCHNSQVRFIKEHRFAWIIKSNVFKNLFHAQFGGKDVDWGVSFHYSKPFFMKLQFHYARKTNASLLARIGAEKKVGPYCRFCSYRSFGPLVYVTDFCKHHDFSVSWYKDFEEWTWKRVLLMPVIFLSSSKLHSNIRILGFV